MDDYRAELEQAAIDAIRERGLGYDAGQVPAMSDMRLKGILEEWRSADGLVLHSDEWFDLPREDTPGMLESIAAADDDTQSEH